jgi:hypothetical protein
MSVCPTTAETSSVLESVKCVCWAGLAALSLAFGLQQAMHPEHSENLRMMHGWVVEWLGRGANVYADFKTQADYPPHAMVFLSLFRLVDTAWLPAIWATLKIALAPAVAYLAVVLVRPSATWAAAALPVAMGRARSRCHWLAPAS